MAAVHFPVNSLYSLIKHHIGLKKRFDTSDEVEFSILFFEYTGGDQKMIVQVFKKVLRDSDAIFTMGDDFILLLPYTDWNGAKKVLEGLEVFVEKHDVDTIVSYPDDSVDARELLMMLNQKVEKHFDKTINFTF